MRGGTRTESFRADSCSAPTVTERRQIYDLARTSYFADDPRVSSDAFLHTEKVLLVDGERRLRGVYNGTQPHEMDRLLEDVARLTASRSSR